METASALTALAERARAAVGADRCTVYQVDHEQGQIFSRVAQGLEEGAEIRLPLTRGVIGFVARTGRPLRLRDAYNDPRFDPSTDQRTGYRTRGILCVPVRNAHGSVLGAIQVINKASGPFTEDDERTLTGLSAEAAGLLSA
jgi:adenylate cyclase